MRLLQQPSVLRCVPTVGRIETKTLAALEARPRRSEGTKNVFRAERYAVES